MNLTSLNQKIILKTGVFGIFMGFSTTLGWCQEKEIYILIIMITATILYLKNKLKKNLFIHCIIIGLSWGFDCSLVQVLFFKTYSINNPFLLNEIIHITSFRPKLVVIVIGVFIVLSSGFLIYFLFNIIKKINK